MALVKASPIQGLHTRLCAFSSGVRPLTRVFLAVGGGQCRMVRTAVGVCSAIRMHRVVIDGGAAGRCAIRH